MSRPLTDEQLKKLTERGFEGDRLSLRNRLLVIFQCHLGFRISEVLSFKMKEVFEFDPVSGKIRRVLDRIVLEKSKRKGGRKGRDDKRSSVETQTQITDHILKRELMEYATEGYHSLFKTDPLPDDALFRTLTDRHFPITADHASKIIRNGHSRIGTDNVGKRVFTSHSHRKTAAKKIYEASGKDLLATQKYLGHKALTSTQCYLRFMKQEEVDAIAMKMWGEQEEEENYRDSLAELQLN